MSSTGTKKATDSGIGRTTNTNDVLSLPEEVWARGIFRFLSLSDLLIRIRPLCRLLSDLADKDPRWIPIIAPPSLCDEVLSMEKHGEQLRQLFFQHLKWYNDEDGSSSSVKQCSALDGFFSLAPWRSCGESYPTPWLHCMVYHKPCPTTIVQRATVRKRPARKRLRIGNDSNKVVSTFYNQRKRVEEDVFRLFDTTSICPLPSFEKVPQTIIILQGINIRNQKGEVRNGLPDHNISRFNNWTQNCFQVMECYFGKNSTIIPEIMEYSVDLRLGKGNCRRRHGVFQINGECLDQFEGDPIVERLCSDIAATSKEKDFSNVQLIYLLASHMHPPETNYSWCYAMGLPPCHGYEKSVFSTFPISEWVDNPENQVRLFTNIIMSAALQHLRSDICLDACESSPCIMNVCDSVEETEMGATLLLCPTCLCKLRLAGLVSDVPVFFNQLYQVLNKEPFRNVCQNDLELLQKYGAATSSIE